MLNHYDAEEILPSSSSLPAQAYYRALSFSLSPALYRTLFPFTLEISEQGRIQYLPFSDLPVMHQGTVGGVEAERRRCETVSAYGTAKNVVSRGDD